MSTDGKGREDYWDCVRKLSESMADKLDDAEIFTTLADLSCELAQYSLRLAHQESVYKNGSILDFFCYLNKVSLFGMSATEVLKEHESLRVNLEDMILDEYKQKYGDK